MTAKEEWKSWFTSVVDFWKDETGSAIFTTLAFGAFLYMQYHVIMMNEKLIFKLAWMFIAIPLMTLPFAGINGIMFLMDNIFRLSCMVVVRPVVWVTYKLVH